MRLETVLKQRPAVANLTKQFLIPKIYFRNLRATCFYIITVLTFLRWSFLFLSGLKGYFYYLCTYKT